MNNLEQHKEEVARLVGKNVPAKEACSRVAFDSVKYITDREKAAREYIKLNEQLIKEMIYEDRG